MALMQSLPLELRRQIAGCVEAPYGGDWGRRQIQDLVNLRLTCKAFEDVAAVELFAVVSLGLDRKDVAG